MFSANALEIQVVNPAADFEIGANPTDENSEFADCPNFDAVSTAELQAALNSHCSSGNPGDIANGRIRQAAWRIKDEIDERAKCATHEAAAEASGDPDAFYDALNAKRCAEQLKFLRIMKLQQAWRHRKAAVLRAASSRLRPIVQFVRVRVAHRQSLQLRQAKAAGASGGDDDGDGGPAAPSYNLTSLLLSGGTTS